MEIAGRLGDNERKPFTTIVIEELKDLSKIRHGDTTITGSEVLKELTDFIPIVDQCNYDCDGLNRMMAHEVHDMIYGKMGTGPAVKVDVLGGKHPSDVRQPL